MGAKIVVWTFWNLYFNYIEIGVCKSGVEYIISTFQRELKEKQWVFKFALNIPHDEF
jgi:hypothetical protein